MQATDQPQVGEGDLKSALEHNPAVPDDRSQLHPHGEKLKGGPYLPEFNPNVVSLLASSAQT